MIQHIFTLIWNERKTNVLIVLEFVVIFCVLWFCCDFLWFVGNRWFEPRGFDIEHTYRLNMGSKPNSALTEEQGEASRDEQGNILQLMERIKRYPGVEAVGISNSGLPYSWSFVSTTFFRDTVGQGSGIQVKTVSPGYFDVFKINLTKGKRFNWPDPAQNMNVIITPDNKGEFIGIPTGQVDRFYDYNDRQNKFEPSVTAIGVTGPVKMNDFEPYGNTVFQPISRNYFQEIAIRVSPEVDNDGFAEHFYRDMCERLDFGKYYLQSVTPLSDLRRETNRDTYNTLNGVFSVIGFLIVNIFLGVLGTFWLRTQSRHAEIGLRMALGASRRKVHGLLIGETFLLLTVAAVVGAVVCLNIGQTDMLSSIGVPTVDRGLYGIGHEQDAINFALTFAFLTVVSVSAVWYPARQAAKTQPAEVLHEE